MTPGGIPARAHSSAMIIVAPGSRSDGFTTKVLPIVSEDRVRPTGHCGQSRRPQDYPERQPRRATAHMAGKLKGVIAAVTPSGRRRE